MNKKTIIFLILFIISLFFSFLFNLRKIDIPYFSGIYKHIKVDVIFNQNPPKVFYGDKEINSYTKIDNNHYLFEHNRSKKIEEISFDDVKNISQLIIYNDYSVKFIDNITKKIKINNDKPLLDKVCISFLSFFYNPQYFIIPYIFLFLFLYNFQAKKDYKIKNYVILLLILSAILRIVQINSIPFWDDEIYILAHTCSYAKIIDLFNDPGNPPLYFILFKIYRSIITNQNYFRYSSVILGILFNIAFFNYLKYFLKDKKALIGLFIASINITLIYLSQEIRCYMLMMLLAIISSFLLFKFKNQNKWKYFIVNLALLYTHFFGALFVSYNFLFGLYLFKKNKDKLKNFFMVNLISFILYLPLIFYKHTSITSDFNTWIELPTIKTILTSLESYFGHLAICLLITVLLFLIYQKSKIREKIFINYNFLIIPFIITSAVIISYSIKPIFSTRYLYIFFPHCLALITLIICHDYKTKLKPIISCLLFLILTTSFQLTTQYLSCNHNIFLKFVSKNLDKSKTNYVFLSDTLKDYREFRLKNVKTNYVPINHGIKTLNLKGYDIKKNSILYVHNLYLDDNIYKIAKKIDLYKTPLGIFCKIEL